MNDIQKQEKWFLTRIAKQNKIFPLKIKSQTKKKIVPSEVERTENTMKA